MNEAPGGTTVDRERPAAAGIVARVAAGETHLYGTLVERYQQRLYWSCLRLLGDPDEADDVVQEAFVRAYAHLHDFDPAHRFYTWIYKIARNRALNVLRGRRVRGFLSLSDEDEAPPLAGDDDAARAVEERELATALDACRGALPPDQREVFDLRHAEDLSYAEIAAATGVPTGTVMSRLSRARARMRDCLREKGVRWGTAEAAG